MATVFAASEDSPVRKTIQIAGAKALDHLGVFTARLKPCPDTSGLFH